MVPKWLAIVSFSQNVFVSFQICAKTCINLPLKILQSTFAKNFRYFFFCNWSLSEAHKNPCTAHTYIAFLISIVPYCAKWVVLILIFIFCTILIRYDDSQYQVLILWLYLYPLDIYFQFDQNCFAWRLLDAIGCEVINSLALGRCGGHSI